MYVILTNHNNIINVSISYNYMPTFHYICVLFITYNPDNIS